ncbi:MAG: glycosyltransferase, partial [Bacteroidota bacterium]|nr:glycosyltransferase [Bacteroidota bacterium]
MRKTCATLQRAGWEPVLIGRRMNRADAVSIDRPYRTERLWLQFHTGPLFYLSLQLGLCRALARLQKEGGVTAVWANDLDTLGPAVEASRRYGWAVAYDSHEWFTEAEGLNGQPLKKAIWRRWERRCFRGINRMLTVNDAIAEAYAALGPTVEVVPNVPERLDPAQPMPRAELGWPEGSTMLLMQGAFMDRDRGALDAVRAMVHLPELHLALIGAGPEHAEAGPLAERLGVADR